MFLGFMAITHSLIAAAGVCLLLSSANPLILGLAVLGSQLPDLDTSTSLIGQLCFPISHWIEDRYPHRSITHSLMATGAIALISLLLNHFFLLGDIKVALALPLGHLLSCFSDCFTKQGVQLFWPDPAWAISVSNPNRRIRTGSPAEYWVLVVATTALVLGIWIATGGGAVQKVSQQLGLKDGILAVYNQNAATHQVWAEIKGVHSSDRSTADGRYFILGTAGSEFIVTDGDGIYKTNDQIIPSKLNTDVGEAAQTKITTLTLNDEDALPPLQQLQGIYPNGAIYLTGTITIDFPEDIRIIENLKEYETLKLSGTSITFNYCPIEKAIAALKDQYGNGTLTAKIISPKPFP